MKRLLFFVCFLFGLNAFGQNLQLHYDYGRAKNGDQDINRGYVTATFEHFSIDKLGNTFIFFDFDFGLSTGNTSLAYTEISRNWQLPHVGKLQLHTEFNGGLMINGDHFIQIPNAWLLGLTYPIQIGKFTLPVSISYRQQQDAKQGPDFQLTTTWMHNFWKDRITFCGFIDIWTQDKVKFDEGNLHEGKQLTILTEPQLWYNINPSISLGGEVEISRNFFIFDNKFKTMPTVAFKWNL